MIKTTTPTSVEYKHGCGCIYWPLITIAILWITGHLV